MKLSRLVSFLDLFQRLPGVLEHDFIHSLLGAEDFLGVDLKVHGGPLHAGERLMDHDPEFGSRVPLPLGAGGQQSVPMLVH